MIPGPARLLGPVLAAGPVPAAGCQGVPPQQKVT